MSGTIQWSIVLPAHNEAARILPYLRSITSFMQDRGQTYEVLVVDDGSTDSTAAVVESLASSTPEIQLLRAPVRRGKGAAVRRGMHAAVGRLQLFADADGATPIQELARLEQAVANGADVAIGSRALASQLPGLCRPDPLVSNCSDHPLQVNRAAEQPQRNYRHAMRLQTVPSNRGSGPLQSLFDRWLWLRSRTALCRATTRIPYRRNPGELVPSTQLKVSCH